MKLKVDKSDDALYLRLDDSSIAESEEVAPGVVLDFNEDNEVVGVEILHISKGFPDANWNSFAQLLQKRVPRRQR